MIGHAVLVTAPAAEPFQLTEAKAHLRVDFTDDDDYIDSLIVAARRQVENETKRALATQTWDYYLNGFPACDSVPLPFGQLQSVSSLKYTDYLDSETTVATSVYQAVTWEDPGRIVLKYGQSWPTATLRTAGGVVVRFVCGYGAPSSIPADLLHSMKLRIAHWYDNREEIVVGQGVVVNEVPNSAKALAWPYRINIL